MGTLIPLAPALAGLAKGDVAALSSNLRVAFSITVLGLLIGALAFAVSLVRDRLYGQDLSDLQFVASELVTVVKSRFVRPARVIAPTAAATRSTGWSTCSTSASCCRWGSCSPPCSLNLQSVITNKRQAMQRANQVVVKAGERAQPLRPEKGRVIGHGQAVGRVYRLTDGRLVYVQDAGK